MMTIIAASRRCLLAASLALAAFGTAPAAAQSIEQVDPNDYAAIDADLDQPQDTPSPAEPARDLPPEADPAIQPAPAEPGTSVTGYGASQPLSAPSPASATSETYHEDDLIGAAEGVFGKGAEGVARMIEDLLKKQGEPNGYIVGREAGAAVGLGVRYGSGTLYHKIEGQMPVYWTGPSLGFDLGANASNTFVLVYNLYDTDELYERYPAGEGDAYLVGGLTASYLRKGDVVLIPIRMGAGVRLGINAGYMKFSRKQRWLPF